MTSEAIILVTDPEKSVEDYLGLPLLKRTVLSAQRSGIERFIIVAEDSRERLSELLTGDNRIHSTIVWTDCENLSNLLGGMSSKSVMLIRAEAVFDSDVIKKMDSLELGDVAACVAVRKGAEGHEPAQCTLRLDGHHIVNCALHPVNQTDKEHIQETTTDVQTAGLILTRPDILRDVVAEFTNGRMNLHGITDILLSTGKVRALDVTGELCMEIDSRETVHESKERLFRLPGLASDSPFSIYVNRRLSRLVSGILVRFPVTPNLITLLSFFRALWPAGFSCTVDIGIL